MDKDIVLGLENVFEILIAFAHNRGEFGATVPYGWLGDGLKQGGGIGVGPGIMSRVFSFIFAPKIDAIL